MESRDLDVPGAMGRARDDDADYSAPAGQVDLEIHPAPWSGLPALTSPNTDRATAPAPAPGREPTLTAQIRNVQPPDVARQAMSELGVLAGELDALPEALAEAGLAPTHAQAYRELAQDYLSLCHYAWEAVAEEQLEQAGAEPEYRQSAVAVARRLSRLKQEAEHAASADEPRRAVRLPLLWRRRISLMRQGLAAWQAQLSPVPDPLRMGRGLFELQGYIGLAAAGGWELTLLDGLTSGALVLIGMLTTGALLLVGGGIASHALQPVPLYAAIAASGTVAWIALILLGVTGALPLGHLMGASVFVPQRAASLGWRGSPFVAGLLRGWWILVGCATALVVPVALALGGLLLVANGPLRRPANLLQAVNVGGTTLYVSLLLPAAACVAALLLLAIPFGLVAQTRFVRELVGNVFWVPAARRYALRPALSVVVVVAGLLVALAYGAGTGLGWQHVALVSVALGPVGGTLSLRAVLYAVVLVLPYLLLVELPYRLGIRHWRARRLADLAGRRADLESQVRRLATQLATADVLRAMQYDLVLLQFYRGQVDEARATSAAPFRIEGPVTAAILAILAALVLDGAGALALRLLLGLR